LSSANSRKSLYEKLEMIGEGTYGVVYRARNREFGYIVALKKIRLADDEDEGIPSTALREIVLLKHLKHPNVVTLHEVINRDNRLYLAFEFLDYDLKKYMDSHSGLLPESTIQSLLFQLIAGIEYCHRKRVLHRDLKPQNLLIDKNGVLKLADFGLARSFQVPLREYTHEIITLWYRPPEVLLGGKCYTCAVDMWSIGTIFGEMMIKRALFAGDSEIDQLFKIFRFLGTPTPQTWPGVEKFPDFQGNRFPVWKRVDLQGTLLKYRHINTLAMDIIERTLTYDPECRPSALQLLYHPYFDNVDAKVKCQSGVKGAVSRRNTTKIFKKSLSRLGKTRSHV